MKNAIRSANTRGFSYHRNAANTCETRRLEKD